MNFINPNILLTPTIDVYSEGDTLGIGNINASTINIGKNGTTINIAGIFNASIDNLSVANINGIAYTQFIGTATSLTNTSIIASNASLTNLSVANINGISYIPFTGNANATSLTNTSIIIANQLINASNASLTNLSVANINGIAYIPFTGNANATSLTNTSIIIANQLINASNASLRNLSVGTLTTNTINNTIINSYSPNINLNLFGNYLYQNLASSIAFNGNNQFMVGSLGFDSAKGKVDIYSFINNSWKNVSTINGTGTFGNALGISTDGTVIAVGKYTYSVGADTINNNEYNQGAVDIYKFSSNDYETASRINMSTIKFNNSDSKNMLFGSSLALSGDGNTLVVGSPNFLFGGSTLDTGYVTQGRVDIFNYNNISWVNISTIYGSNTQSGGTWDGLGNSCSINSNGTIIAVGSNNFSNKRGKIDMFEYNTSWRKTHTVFGSGDYENMGRSCAINSNGTILCVGCNAINAYGGRAYIYKYSNSTLSNVSNIDQVFVDGFGEALGSSCSINSTGDIVCIGSYLYRYGGKNYGRVQVYKYINGWYNIYTLFEPITTSYNSNQTIGTTCALTSDGTIVAGGSPSYFGSEANFNSGLLIIRQFSNFRSNIVLSNTNSYNTTTKISNIMNVVISDNGLISNVGGGYNTVVGMNSMIANINGNYNTAIGYNSLNANTGSNNTGIGSNANCSVFSNSTAIGFNASNTANNQIVLGNGTEQVYIPGNLRVIGSVTGSSAYITSSDFRIKENISYITDEYDISKLKPCQFNYINSSNMTIGFIAQDVEEVIPLSVTGKDDDLKGIDYSAITSSLVITIKKLIERTEYLEKVLKKHNLSLE